MKLKQALIIGLSSAILAVPAIAAESATDLNSLPAANQPAAVVTPAQKEAMHHRKRAKKVSLENEIDPKQTKENAKLDELNKLNPATETEKDQTEKNSIKS